MRHDRQQIHIRIRRRFAVGVGRLGDAVHGLQQRPEVNKGNYLLGLAAAASRRQGAQECNQSSITQSFPVFAHCVLRREAAAAKRG
jgi:hypothetical protein